MSTTKQCNHYDVLGISQDADAREIRSAWRVLVQKWHPDLFAENEREEAELRTSEINGAYHVLRDSARRAAYDCRLAADEAAQEADVQVRCSRRMKEHENTPLRDTKPVVSEDFLEQANRELMNFIRKKPKSVAFVAGFSVLFIGAAMAWSAVTAPPLPASSSHDSLEMSALTTDMHESDEAVAEFAQLADKATEQAKAEDDRFAKQLAADSARQAKLDALEDARIRAEAIRAVKAAKKKRSAGVHGSQRRVVTVLPNGQIVG